MNRLHKFFYEMFNEESNTMRDSALLGQYSLTRSVSIDGAEHPFLC